MNRFARFSSVSAALALLVTTTLAACPSTQTKPDDTPDDKVKVEVPKLGPAPVRNRVSPFDAGVPVPDSVMAVGGIPSLEALGGVASEISASAGFGGADDVLEVETIALEGLAATFGWSDTSWVDLKAPMYAVMPNQKRFDEGRALLVPIKNYPAALAALPKTAGMDVGEHTAAYRQDGMEVYVDVVGHHMVLTNRAKLFAATQSVYPKVVAWNPDGIGTVFVLPGSIRRAYAKELAQMVASLPALFELAGGDALIDIKSMLALVMRFLEESELYRFTALRQTIGNTKHVGMEMGLMPVKGSGLAQVMQHLSRSRLPWPNMMPAAAWFGGLADMDLRKVASYDAFLKGQNKALADKLRKLAGDKAADAFIKLGDEITNVGTGKSMFAAHGDAGFPMAASGIWGMTMPAKELRKKYNTYLELMLPVLWDQIVTEMAADNMKMPQLKKPSLKAMLKLANKGLKDVAMSLKRVKKGKGAVLSDALVLAPKKLSKKQKNNEDLKMLHDIVRGMGGKIEAALAYGPNVMTVGFGPNGLANAESLAAGKGFGGSKVMSSRGVNAATVAMLNLGELFAALKAIPNVGGMFPVPSIPKDEAMVFSVHAKGAEGSMRMLMPDSYIKTVSQFLMF